MWDLDSNEVLVRLILCCLVVLTLAVYLFSRLLGKHDTKVEVQLITLPDSSPRAFVLSHTCIVSAPCTRPLFLVTMVVVGWTFVTMVVIDWTGYECKSDDEACTKLTPFFGGRLNTNDGNIESCMS